MVTLYRMALSYVSLVASIPYQQNAQTSRAMCIIIIRNGGLSLVPSLPGKGCQIAKFDPFLSLDCARVEGVGAQSKERKGSNFAVQRSGAIVQKPEGPNTYHLKKSGYSHLATMFLAPFLRMISPVLPSDNSRCP